VCCEDFHELIVYGGFGDGCRESADETLRRSLASYVLQMQPWSSQFVICFRAVHLSLLKLIPLLESGVKTMPSLAAAISIVFLQQMQISFFFCKGARCSMPRSLLGGDNPIRIIIPSVILTWCDD
jgi:hypothetical protein